MLDDHKYSLNRIVAYAHQDPAHPPAVYGPGGPQRTYGLVTEVHRVEDDNPHWEYTVRNSFTGETCRAAEEEIFHGADRSYLDLYRRETVPWSQRPPEAARNNLGSGFWKHTLRQFVRTAIPRILQREQDEEKARTQGRSFDLGPGDYVKIRGDLRPEMETHHNLYAKVLSVSTADLEHMDIPRGRQGIGAGRHRVLLSYRVLLDSGAEADVYDVEIKTVYTTHGRTIILNWRAAAFLAEAFGDDPPYDLQLEYLNGHVFSRAELKDMSVDDLAGLLSRLIYVKGLATSEELAQKADALSKSPSEYLVDQILEISRFDMSKNRPMTRAEIEQFRSEDEQLRGLFE